MIRWMSDGRLNENMVICTISKLGNVDKCKHILIKNDDFIFLITIVNDNEFIVWLGIRIVLKHLQ